MLKKIRFWLIYRYDKVVNSIAFYPAFIALLFLVTSYISISFDFSDTGKSFKSYLGWISLKDAETARSIITVIAGGIISLAVFSFSMVMIVLNQAASHMTNRVLNKLIGNRFQQIVLGFYVGTIIYAFFLLSTIRDIDSGIYVPAISTYLLIIFSVIDIFLFVYFLHFITQAVKYEVIISKVYHETLQNLRRSCRLKEDISKVPPASLTYYITAPRSGVYTGADINLLLDLCVEYDCIANIIYNPGTFILEGLPLIKINREPTEEQEARIMKTVYLEDDETIQKNFFYGFGQLAEIAIKALSPGINDPGTAILALRALFRLFSYRVCAFPENVIADKQGVYRIYTTEPSFEDIFDITVVPIWDYGKNDRMVQVEMHRLLTQFLLLYNNKRMEDFFGEVRSHLKKD